MVTPVSGSKTKIVDIQSQKNRKVKPSKVGRSYYIQGGRGPRLSERIR